MKEKLRNSRFFKQTISFQPLKSVDRQNCEVLVMDDDPSVRKGLMRFLSDHDYDVRLFDEPEKFFAYGQPESPSCLLLDNQLGGGKTGVEVHAEIVRRGWYIPTVFLTAHWNVKTIVDVLRAGADGFLTKPYDPVELLEAVDQAIIRSRRALLEKTDSIRVRAKFEALTKREIEVVRLVVAGLLNKEIADKLGIALVTVKVHRGRAMKKLGAGNPASLAKLAAEAGIV